MAKPGRHNELIKEIAREVLEPLGLAQVGRSRTFVDDRGWFAVLVDFQPSSFSRGSYLNVGAMWLWDLGDAPGELHLDYGNRVGSFASAEDSGFAGDVRAHARLAAEKVEHYRKLFRRPRDCARRLERDAERRYDWLLDAAIARGIAGQLRRARRDVTQHDAMLAGAYARDSTAQWYRDDVAHWEAKRGQEIARAAAVRDALRDETTFRSFAEQRIRETRAALKLDPDFVWPS